MNSASITLSTLVMVTHCASWNYEERGHNVSHWESLYPECGYFRQSPIDLPVASSSACKAPLELDWSSEHAHYAIRNNGHSLQAIPFHIDHTGGSDMSGLEVMHHTNDTNIRLKNTFFATYSSSVNQEYCFDSLHFHWGRTNREGSEHTVNGHHYPLELHLVHYSCDYKLAGDALKEYASGQANVKYDDDNVLGVIGVMFEIGAANPVLDQILDDIIIDGIDEHKANSPDFPHYLELFYTEFDVKQLLPESRDIVSYLGSLTTPPCYETVRWHVLKEVMTVSEEQMEQFRQLLESTDLNDTMAPNFRPIQPRNARKIWQCQEHVEMDIIDDGQNTVNVVIQQTEEAKQWKDIAVGFIILFILVTLSCLLILCYLCKTHGKIQQIDRKSSSYKTPQNEMVSVKSDDNTHRVVNDTN